MNKNIIFLDIDGVLNSQIFFNERKRFYFNFQDEYYLYNYLDDIDMNKVYMLIEFCQNTNSNIVISSTWKRLKHYPLIEEYLVNLGLPIIDVTENTHDYNRTKEISDYLDNHIYNNYLIIDDDFFDGFEKFYGNFIYTSNFNGLTEDDLEYGKLILKR